MKIAPLPPSFPCMAAYAAHSVEFHVGVEIRRYHPPWTSGHCPASTCFSQRAGLPVLLATATTQERILIKIDAPLCPFLSAHTPRSIREIAPVQSAELFVRPLSLCIYDRSSQHFSLLPFLPPQPSCPSPVHEERRMVDADR